MPSTSRLRRNPNEHSGLEHEHEYKLTVSSSQFLTWPSDPLNTVPSIENRYRRTPILFNRPLIFNPAPSVTTIFGLFKHTLSLPPTAQSRSGPSSGPSKQNSTAWGASSPVRGAQSSPPVRPSSRTPTDCRVGETMASCRGTWWKENAGRCENVPPACKPRP